MKKGILLVSAVSILGCVEQTPTKEKWLCTLPNLDDVYQLSLDYENQTARIRGETISEKFQDMVIPILQHQNTVSLLFGDDGAMDLEKISKYEVRVTAREDPTGPMVDSGSCKLEKK